MSNTIDERVVEARFDNRQFQQGVASTLSSLKDLNKGLQLEGASKGLDGVAQATSRCANRFSVMRVAAYTAIASITRQALFAGERIVSAFTLDPVKAGFENYETQINAIQTILANTGLKGKKGLSQVNGVLKELNTYANKTVYNFSEMAKNIGTFTAAGVKLKPAAESIKGIANLAALSGSNSQQASTAMYQLSQAIAAGRVKLQDWNSVVNAGLGGKVLQKALFNTGVQFKTIKDIPVGETFDQWTKAGNSFRNSLQSGWITSKVLTSTLQQFTGDLSDAQLKSMGYNAAQIKQIQALAKVAVDSATKIKTAHQLVDALKEEVATAYSSVFKTLFGNINQAKAEFSALHTFLENGLTRPIYAFNKVLQGWTKLGGRTKLIDGLKDAFKALASFVKPIKDAFREIFPATTAKTLYNLTVGLDNFFKKIKIGAATANNLKRTFAGVFAVLDIGWQVIKTGVKFFAELFGAVTKGQGSGGFLGATGSLGDFLVALDKTIKKGQFLTKFFDGLLRVLQGPIHFIHVLAAALFGLFNHFPSGDKLSGTFSPLTTLGHVIIGVWTKIGGVFDNVFGSFAKFASHFSTFFAGIGHAVSQGLGGMNFTAFLHALNTGLFAGLVLIIKKFVTNLTGSGSAIGSAGSLVDTIKEPFEALTGTLKQMQSTLKAATLLEIAAAVGILATSAVALSKIDAGGLTRALTAISGMLIQLFASLALFGRIGGVGGISRTAAGLILFAVALRAMTSSVKALSKLSWKDLAKGLTGVTVLIAGLTLAVRGISGQNGGMIRSSAGLILLAVAIRILANSVTKIAKLSWGQMARGLTGVATLLAALSLYSQFQDTDGGGVLAGAGIILLATGIKILASALKDISSLSWSQLGKGLVGMAGGLAAISIALNLIPPSSVLSAAAVLIVATSLGMIAKALSAMGKLSGGAIAKSLIELAGSLTIIALAMAGIDEALPGAAALLVVAASLRILAPVLQAFGAMSGKAVAKSLIELAGALAIIAIAMAGMDEALPGAAALLVVAASLRILTPVLTTLGNMSWGEIVKGLTALAGVFAVLGVAGLVLTPVVPTLLALGGAIALVGVGVAAAGAGVLLFATGLAALSAAGAGAALAVTLVGGALIGLIPALVTSFAKGIGAFAVALGVAAPEIFNAFKNILLSMLDVIDKVAPKIITTVSHILVRLGDTLAKDTPRLANDAAKIMLGILHAIEKHETPIINAMAKILYKLLSKIDENEPRFIAKGVDIVVNFIKGISQKVGRLIQAGTDLIVHLINGIADADVKIVKAALRAVVKFVNGLADAIRTESGPLRQAGVNLISAVLDGITGGLASKAGNVLAKIKNLGSSMINSMKGVLKINSPSKEFMKLGEGVDEGLAKGLVGGRDQVKSAMENIQGLLTTALQSSAQDVTEAKQRLETLAHAHTKNELEIRRETKALQEAESEHKRAKIAIDDVKHSMDHEHDRLLALSKRYDEYTNKIDKATQSLKDAKQTRDDYNSSIADQYSTLPDIDESTTTVSHQTDVDKQIADTKKFAEVLQKLRKMGLDDDTYKLLLSKGFAALPYAEDLLNSGQNGIQNLDKSDAVLDKLSKQLGKTASSNLYQAGVDAAQGVVDGLEKKRKAIADAMSHIADDIVKQLKKDLKIKSPSRVMRTLGSFAAQGLADGMENLIPTIQKSATSVATAAKDALRKSLSTMSSALEIDTDISPTITPVLDLSSIRKHAPMLSSLLAPDGLNIDSTYLKAKYASKGYQDNKDAASAATAGAATAPGDISFIQNNYSPKALTPVEIYRQTNNQLSLAKGALASNAA